MEVFSRLSDIEHFIDQKRTYLIIQFQFEFTYIVNNLMFTNHGTGHEKGD